MMTVFFGEVGQTGREDDGERGEGSEGQYSIVRQNARMNPFDPSSTINAVIRDSLDRLARLSFIDVAVL